MNLLLRFICKISSCIVIILIMLSSNSLYAQKSFDREQYLEATKELRRSVTKEQFMEFASSIKERHPYYLDSIGNKSFKEIIEAIDFPEEPITNAESTFYLRKFLDYLTEEDLHIIATPRLHYSEDYKVTTEMLKAPPFRGLLINDTLLVHQSLDKDIKLGDQVLAINRIPVSNLLDYCYKLKYMDMFDLMYRYYYNISDTYNITLRRDNEEIEIEVKGVPVKKYYKALDGHLSFNSKILDDYNVGYFKIMAFENNHYLFKKLDSFGKKLKRNGVNNLILDLSVYCN